MIRQNRETLQVWFYTHAKEWARARAQAKNLSRAAWDQNLPLEYETCLVNTTLGAKQNYPTKARRAQLQQGTDTTLVLLKCKH